MVLEWCSWMRREIVIFQGLLGSVIGLALVFQFIDIDFRFVIEMGENVFIILSIVFGVVFCLLQEIRIQVYLFFIVFVFQLNYIESIQNLFGVMVVFMVNKVLARVVCITWLMGQKILVFDRIILEGFQCLCLELNSGGELFKIKVGSGLGCGRKVIDWLE